MFEGVYLKGLIRQMWFEKDELVVRSLRTWEALKLELCKGRNLNKGNHGDGEWVHAGNS